MENISPQIEMEIRKLGLSKKEANIYLVCLDFGYSSVQNIAKISKLSRPTTYRLIDELERKGLLKKIKQRGNTLIAPESPDELLGILRSKKRKIEEQEREFLRIIALLNTKYSKDQKNEIKVYSGQIGKKFLLDDFSLTHARDILVFFYSANNSLRFEIEKVYENIKKRLGFINIKEFYPDQITPSQIDFIKRRKIPYIKFPFPGTVIISDKIYFFNEEGALMIEHESIVLLFKALSFSLWESSMAEKK